jgi:DNA-directed RNA polymerase subunit E'
MYSKVTIKDKIRVPPPLFKSNLKKAIEKVIMNEYEGALAKNAGILIILNEIKEIGEGIIIPEDGAIYYDTVFEMIAWEPRIHEVVEGNVTEVREFGIFLRMGPIDGLVHMSQVMDDFVNYGKGGLTGKQSGRTVKLGDSVRARIIAISLKSKEGSKIGLTMRQLGMGKLEWVEQEFAEKKEKKEAKK